MKANYKQREFSKKINQWANRIKEQRLHKEMLERHHRELIRASDKAMRILENEKVQLIH